MLQDMVRRFVDEELIPLEGRSLDGQKLKPEIEDKLTARCKELGLWQIDVPEELGGQGLGTLGRSIVWSELGRTVALPTRVVRILGPEIRAPLYALKGEMRERYLMPTIRGERESCFAQTEPDAGSDPGAMRTTAVRDGDHYVINGVKRFITGADNADFVILMAATDRSKGSRGGISCFVLDMDTPGVKLTHLLPDAHRRDAVGDRVRQRAHPRTPSRRQGRRRLQPRPEMARRRPHQAGRPRARRHPPLPRTCLRLRQAARHLRPADRRAARRSRGASSTPMSRSRPRRCLCIARPRATTAATTTATKPIW